MKWSGWLFPSVTSERKRILTLFFVISMMFGSLSAQRMIAHRGTVKDAYNFWFYVPPVIAPADSAVVPPVVIDSIKGEEGDLMEAMVRKPLVIFLHGASLRGRNLSMVRRYGTLDALSKGLNLDAYVLAPQHPTGGWQPDRINRLVDWALERYAIDSTKLQKELGWEPSLQFEEGIERTVKWYLENQEWMDNITSGEYEKYYDDMYKNR